MPIEGDVYAIAKTLKAGSTVHDDTKAAGELLVLALKKMVSKPGRGRVYTTEFFTDKAGKVIPIGSRAPHRASAPGDPPAPDTFELVNSIDWGGKRLPDGTELQVGSTAEHAVYTEFGTEKMEARPWFRVTMLRMRPRIVAIYAKGIEQRERALARKLGGRG